MDTELVVLTIHNLRVQCHAANSEAANVPERGQS
jgi:hypothetical protein